MIYHVLTALVASATTACFMRTIIPEFFKRQKEKQIVSRVKYFKNCHKNYWAKGLDDGTTEFWAYSCVDDDVWYLGKKNIEGKIIEVEGFYRHALPWDVQKGAERVFRLHKE